MLGRMPQRMFVAVVPPAEVVEDLSEFLEPRRDSGMPWIHPEQWHVTLAFMEAVADRSIDPLVEHLDEAAAKRRPFTLRMSGAGAFPDPARAKVLWLGLRNGVGLPETGELERLAVNVRAAASTAGAAVDGKAFRPHLSLARLKRPVESTRWLRILDTYAGRPWHVDEIELIASHLGDGPNRRPRHEVVKTFALDGSQPGDDPAPF
jgi:2'-5' RNA ligase